MPIYNRPDPLLMPGDFTLKPLPLAGKTLDSIDFTRRQVYLLQLLRIDKGHLSQGERIDFVALR